MRGMTRYAGEADSAHLASGKAELTDRMRDLRLYHRPGLGKIEAGAADHVELHHGGLQPSRIDGGIDLRSGVAELRL